MAFLLGNLADAAARHWKRSLVFVLVALAAIAGLTTLGTGFSDDFDTPGTDSQEAYDLLSERFPPSRATPRPSCSRLRTGRCATATGPRRSPRRRGRSPASLMSPRRRTR